MLLEPQIEVKTMEPETLWAVYPPPYQGEDDGRVVWGARFRGSIGNEMDLRNFPIDSDSVHITGPKNATMDKVMLVVDPKKHRRCPRRRRRSARRPHQICVPHRVAVRRAVRARLIWITDRALLRNAEFIVIVHRNFMFQSVPLLKEK